MMKRYLRIFLSVMLMLSLLCVTAFATEVSEETVEVTTEQLVVSVPAANATTGTCGENVTWTLDESGTLTISGTGKMKDFTADTVPWYENRKDITSVIIEDGVTHIGDYAFAECPYLGKLAMADSVVTIGKGICQNCSYFYDLVVGNGVTTIGDSAFWQCSNLQTVTIGENVTHIGDRAFNSCQKIESITIPDSVTYIGERAFRECVRMTEVTVGKGVTHIGDEAFSYCGTWFSAYGSYLDLTFRGNAPEFGEMVFDSTKATCHYPAEDASWTDAVKQNYGGTITWESYGAVLLGDLDDNGIVDDEDVIYLLWHTLMPGDYPVAQDVDFDHNGIVDDEDVIYLLWHTLMPGDYPLDGEFKHSEYFIPGVKVDDVILWFNEVCLDAEYVTDGNPSVVQKWRVPIRYWIHGTPTQEDLKTLESFMAQINSIEGFPGMVKADYAAMANLNIHFVNQQGLVNIMGNGYWGHDGAVTFWYDGNNVIYKETICVRTDLSQYVRNSVLQEEIYNGLGPIQDTLLRPDSLIYQNYAEPQAMTQVDELLLKLLYHPDIQWGMDAQACEAVIRNLYY